MPSSRLLMSQNRGVRCDPGADNPMEELASAVRRIGGEPVGLEPQSLLRPMDHRLCRSDLVVSAGWCCLYVDDDRVLDVDQVIEPIAELDALVGFCGPRRARVHRRDHLWRLASSVSVFIIEGRQELCDGARLALGRRPIDLSGSLAMITTGVGFYDARINCEALALDETCIHARSDHRLEHLTEDVAISKTAVAIDRERRMIRNLVFEFETAEPAMMKFDLLAQPPLEADAIAVADDEHSDHQLRVDRGSADVAVERRQLLAKVSQHPRHDWIDAAQEMILGNVFFEVEKIEQLAL